MKNKRRYIHLGLICSLFVVTFYVAQNCGRKDDSRLYTLDNLASGSTIRQNICSGNPSGWSKKHLEDMLMDINVGDAALKTRLGDEVFLAMSALPVVYMDALAALQVRVRVTPRFNELCGLSGQVADVSDALITACILTVPIGGMPNNQDMEGLSIILAPDAAVIRHALVRTVGQIFSQVLAQRYFAKSLDGFVTFDPERFIDLQTQLASAFIEDIVHSKLFTVNHLEPFLGPNADAILRQSIPEFADGKINNPFAPLRISNDKLAQFLTFVTADSFDSFYCQAEDTSNDAYDQNLVASAQSGDLASFLALGNTRFVMRDFFPATFAKFSQINTYMMRMAGDFTKIRPKTSGDSTIVALTANETNDTSTSEFSLDGGNISAERAYTEKRLAEYRKAYDAPPTYMQRMFGPSDSERRTRIREKYLGDLQKASEFARLDKQARTGVKEPPRNTSGASSNLLAGTVGFIEGAVEGEVNVATGTFNAFRDLGTGTVGIASTAYNEGISSGAMKLVTNVSGVYHEKQAAVKKSAEEIGEGYANGQIGFGRGSFELFTAAAGGLPIIGNAADTARNAVHVISETDASGRRLSPAEQSEIARKQGDIAGSAILEAATSKGGEFFGEGTAKLIKSGIQGGGRSATSVATYTSDALAKAGRAGKLSGIGEGLANQATRASTSLQSTNFGISHAAQHTVGGLAEQSLNIGVIYPTYENGKEHNNGSHANGGGETNGHQSANRAHEPVQGQILPVHKDSASKNPFADQIQNKSGHSK